MIVERIYVGGALQNYNYVLICPETLQAMAIDPLDDICVEQVLERHGAKLRYIVLTHHHLDHYQGAPALHEKYPEADVVGHALCKKHVPFINEVVKEGDVIALGQTALFEVIYTPGHMDSHICLWDKQNKIVAVGDTIFNAGVGHCRQGNVEDLFRTIQKLKAMLPKDTRLLTSHDYFQNNLKFAQSLEPSNPLLQSWLEKLSVQMPETRAYSTVGDEFHINPFFRTHDEAYVVHLCQTGVISENKSELNIFSTLRSLRDKW